MNPMLLPSSNPPIIAQLLGIIVFFLTVSPGYSDSQVPVLNLNDALAEARSNNRSLKAAQFKVEEKKAEIRPAGAPEDPMLSFDAMNYPVNSFESSDFEMTGNQVSLSQKIPFPGKLKLKEVKSSHELESIIHALASRTSLIERDLKRDYFKLSALYSNEDLISDKISLLSEVIKSAQARLSVNQISQSDVLDLQSKKAEELLRQIDNRKRVKATLASLNHLLGREHGDLWRPEPLKITRVESMILDPKILSEKAKENNPRIKTLKAKVDAAETAVEASALDRLPDFEVRASYVFRDGVDGRNGDDFVSGGIGISLPIWAGIKQNQLLEASIARKRSENYLLEEEENHLYHNIHEIVAEIEETDDKLNVLESSILPLQRERLNSSRSQYISGNLNYRELLMILNERFSAEEIDIETRAEHEMLIATLEALVGKSLEKK